MKRLLTAVAATGICLGAAISMMPAANAAPHSVTGRQCEQGGGRIISLNIGDHIISRCNGGQFSGQPVR
ncbi:hypothetical protein [Kutzneria sp. 744]|uniref:hypothetical protein n=1 Tax=Kutzneria sp. (strain 744) TaxID=345341 RepID=UPI0004B37E05|nr:hypothetical protein [Kutzneria sp. 744]